jgi:hypothetical protein
MGQFTDRVLNELQDIKEKQAEHNKILAVNTEILTQHHQRSTLLEKRMVPVEDHVKFINKSVKAFAGLVATVAGLAAIFHYLK